MRSDRKTRGARRAANTAAEALWKFTDKLVGLYGTFSDAEKLGNKLLKELPHSEQCRYIGLWNRYAQAFNAWARRTGERVRYRSMHRGRLFAIIRPGPRLMGILPMGGPIHSRSEPRSRRGAEAGLGPNEVEITLPNGGRRIAMYDTEVYAPASSPEASRPPPWASCAFPGAGRTPGQPPHGRALRGSPPSAHRRTCHRGR